MYRNVPTKFLPIVWFEQSFEMDNQMTFMIKLMLWTPFIGRMIGFMIVIGCAYMIFKSVHAEEKKRIRDIENEKKTTKTKILELSPLVNNNI